MRGYRLALVLGVTVLMALGCGGAWDQAMQEQVSEKTNQLRGLTMAVPDSPEKARALAALDEADANAERFGIMDIAMLETEYQKYIKDGVITDEEAGEIEALVARISSE